MVVVDALSGRASCAAWSAVEVDVDVQVATSASNRSLVVESTDAVSFTALSL